MSPLLLLPLLLSAAALAAALRAQVAAGGKFAEDDPPNVRFLTAAQAEQERYEEGLVREYVANLSHHRACTKARDGVQALAPLLLPELKIAFCYIPKAACSQFKDLINTINRIPNAHLGFGRDYLRSTARSMGYKGTVSRASGWKFAIFTRDPALRYLSSYGSTCVAMPRTGNFEHPNECCGPLVHDTHISSERLVKMFQERLYSDYRLGNVNEDDHWAEQVHVFRQCGWDHFNPRKVDFHGDISTGDVNAQVKEMLSINGHHEPYHELVDRFFPKEAVAGHKSPMHQIPPEMFYNDRKTLEALKMVYSGDYQMIPGVGRGFTDIQLGKTTKQRKREWAAWHSYVGAEMGLAKKLNST